MTNVLEIIKQLPKGTKVYLSVAGKEGVFEETAVSSALRIKLCGDNKNSFVCLRENGALWEGGECVVFPSKDHRTWEDWREYYGIKTGIQSQFKPFDKVLVRNLPKEKWKAVLFSYYDAGAKYPYVTCHKAFCCCIPYEGNEKLLGTTDSPKQLNSITMAAKDFMVGDFVFYKGTPIKVENIHEDFINYTPDIPYVQEESFIEYAKLEPIPLTSEILEKNGFVLRDLMYRKTINGDELGILLPKETETDEYKYPEFVYIAQCFNMKDVNKVMHAKLTFHGVVSVHQLQHFIKQCKVKFEIKL